MNKKNLKDQLIGLIIISSILLIAFCTLIIEALPNVFASSSPENALVYYDESIDLNNFSICIQNKSDTDYSNVKLIFNFKNGSRFVQKEVGIDTLSANDYVEINRYIDHIDSEFELDKIICKLSSGDVFEIKAQNENTVNMFELIASIFIFIIFVGGILPRLIKVIIDYKKLINNSSTNLKEHLNNGGILEHSSCESQKKDICIHIDNDAEDEKICKHCGYENKKTAHKCSLCGKRLF